ncbi:MAG: ParB/RepB/Spo0J family partition protein [Gammaproteobacteria bacterium]
MSAKKTGLGKGLDALLGDIDLAPTPTLTEAAAPLPPDAPDTLDGALRQIPVDLLRRGTYQPRQDMKTDALEELADSIREQGLVQPIVVRPVGEKDASGARQYEIVAGERRWRAAQLAGLANIPAIVRDIPDSSAIAVALIENIQRENLNPLEESGGLRRLIDEFEMTHQQAADAVGRSRTAVSNLLRLLDLCDAAKQRLQSGELEMGHARALLSILDDAKQAEVAAQVAAKRLSVRETEALVKRILKGDKPAQGGAKKLDPDIRRLQDDLSDRLGARVQIQHGGKGRGKLVVTYNSLDELDGILAHIQ